MSKIKNIITKILFFLDDVIYYVILVPLMIVTVIVVYKAIVYPDKIPDIFGYKMFIVLDDRMHSSIDFGDLIFTKNVEINSLKNGDVIAARPSGRFIALYDVSSVNEKEDKYVIDLGENGHLGEEYFEGKIINKIAKIGLILYYIQKPLILISIILIILIIGLIIYYIAQQLDYRDMKKLEEMENKKNNEKTEKEKEKVLK